MNLLNLLVKIKHKLFYFPEQNRALLASAFKDDIQAITMPNAIVLAQGMLNSGIKYIRRDPKTNRLILKTKDSIYLATDQYSTILLEVFCYNYYELEEKYLDKRFIVFDFGMNRAYTSLYLAGHPNCQKVYGYEPDPNTFSFAEYNLSLNSELSGKIEAYNFGLAARNGNIDFFIANRDGVNSGTPQMLSILSKQERKNLKKTSVTVKKASEEILRVLATVDKNVKVILKIDVEGAEYEIFDDLCKENVIDKVDLIVGDSHNGLTPILEQLQASGFDIVHQTLPKSISQSMCCGFVFEKKGSWK